MSPEMLSPLEEKFHYILQDAGLEIEKIQSVMKTLIPWYEVIYKLGLKHGQDKAQLEGE